MREKCQMGGADAECTPTPWATRRLERIATAQFVTVERHGSPVCTHILALLIHSNQAQRPRRVQDAALARDIAQHFASSRRCLCWAARDTLHATLVSQALQRAGQTRQLQSPPTLHHSDRGCQSPHFVRPCGAALGWLSPLPSGSPAANTAPPRPRAAWCKA